MVIGNMSLQKFQQSRAWTTGSGPVLPLLDSDLMRNFMVIMIKRYYS